MAVPTHVVNAMDYEMWLGPDETLYSFRTPLDALDGRTRYARVMWRLPRPGWEQDFTDAEIADAKTAFLQVGGSAQEMTVEVRLPGGQGRTGLFTVGRPPAADLTSPPSVTIHVGEYPTRVYPNEVFAAAEAADIWFYYYKNGAVPPSYVLRPTGNGEAQTG